MVKVNREALMAKFKEDGRSLTGWTRKHNFKLSTVKAVLFTDKMNGEVGRNKVDA